MATKPKTRLYVVMYNDHTNINYELTAAQFKLLSEAITDGDKRGVLLEGVGVLVLEDIRAVIEQIVEEKPTPVQGADPVLSPEEIAFMEQYRELFEKGGYQ